MAEFTRIGVQYIWEISMKKISVLFAMLAVVAMAFVTTGCKDGSDGLSATDLIVSQTANVWYRYGDTTQTVTTTDTTNTTLSAASIYVKYNSSNNTLVVAAVSGNYYATSEKELSREKWSVSIAALKVAGKLKVSSDPTSGKTKLPTTASGWGEMAAEKLIETLFN